MVTLFIITFVTQTFSNTYQDSKSFSTEILSSTFEYFTEKVAKWNYGSMPTIEVGRIKEDTKLKI